MLNSHCVPWDEDCHLCNPTEHPVTAQPLTPEQEAEARYLVGQVEPPYLIAAALATIDQLRAQRNLAVADAAEYAGENADLRTEVARLTDTVSSYYRSTRPRRYTQ